MKKNFFKNIFNPLENCEAVTYMLCRKLGVPVTKGYIKQQLEDHPDYPSLLSISDVLNSLGINNGAVKGDLDVLEKCGAPFLVQIKKDGVPSFAVVPAINEKSIHLLDPISEIDTEVPKEAFSKQFTGVILLAEANEHAGQFDYAKAKKKELRNLTLKILLIVSIPLMTILACILSFATNGTTALFPVLYTLLALAGTLVGALLLWYEVDKHNPVLKEICSGGKKVNCNAVLGSSASKILGISWSAIGFPYFAGVLLSLLYSGITSQPILKILSIISLFALPYTVFSVYYQYKIVKQWCRLCLVVQALIALQSLITMGGHFLSTQLFIGWQNYVLISIAFLVPFLATQIIVPSIKTAKEGKLKGQELSRLKHNPQIFETLLVKQKQIVEPMGLGISLGTPNAKYKLVKVCNPYCGPCAKAHPAMEALLENNPEVQVQVIFTATSKEHDMKAPPVKHLLAIAGKKQRKRNEASP